MDQNYCFALVDLFFRHQRDEYHWRLEWVEPREADHRLADAVAAFSGLLAICEMMITGRHYLMHQSYR